MCRTKLVVPLSKRNVKSARAVEELSSKNMWTPQATKKLGVEAGFLVGGVSSHTRCIRSFQYGLILIKSILVLISVHSQWVLLIFNIQSILNAMHKFGNFYQTCMCQLGIDNC